MSAIDITENSPGFEKKVMEQLEREKNGRFVRVDDKTMIFVRSGRDPRRCIEVYKNKMLYRGHK